MPGPNWGRNAGLTGLVDLPNVGASGVKFQIRVYKWSSRLDGQVKPRRGRGGGIYANYRWLFSSGNIAFTGKPQSSGWPAPDQFKGQTGTVTITVDTGKTISYPILVTEIGFSFDENKQDSPFIAGAALLTGSPTYTGWAAGSQPAATDPARSDQTQWPISAKSLDPQGLASTATRHIDIWGGDLADNDDGEQTKLLAVIAAAAPPFDTPHNAKLRSSTFERDSSDGGTITEVWGLTTTAEDVVNPLTSETVDPDGIGNVASVALINDTPATPDGYSDNGLTERELNDSKDLFVRQAGVRTRKEGIEQDGTLTQNDPYDLVDSATITSVHDTSTPPADPPAPLGQLVSRDTQQFQSTPEKWRTTWRYANLNSEQRIEFPGATIENDPSDLTDTDTQHDITDSSTPPATPATRVSGTKIRRITSERVGGTPEKWLHAWHFARTNTEDDVEMPATVTGDDVSNLRDSATICLVTDSGTAPAVPSAPVGQHVETTTTQLHDTRWKHVFRYANNTPEQEVEFGGTEADDDPSDLRDVETVREVTNTSSMPSHSPTIAGLVARRKVSQRIGGTPEKWQHTTHFGRRTTEQDVTFPGTWTEDDQSDLIDEKRITIVDDSTPVAPATPTGYKLVSIRDEQLTDAGKYAWTYTYKRRTNQEAVEFDGTEQTDDASDLADTHVYVRIQSSDIGSATPPATPSGLKLREKSSVQIHDASTGAKWRNTYVFARRNREDDAEMDGSRRTDNASDLETRYEIAVVEADATPDGLGGSAPAGLVLRDTRKAQLHDSKWLITYVYTETTSEQDIEFPGTFTSTDHSGLIDTARATVVNDSSSHSFAATSGSLKLRTSRTTQLTDSGKYRHEAEYGRRSTEDDVEQGGTVYTIDQSGNVVAGSARVTVVEADSNPDLGVSVSGLILRFVEKKQIHDSKWEMTYVFGQTTPEEDIELPGTVTEEDPSDLASVATVTLVNSSATAPSSLASSPPSVGGVALKLRKTRSVQLTNAGRWAHTGHYAHRTEEDDAEQGKTVYDLDQSGVVVSGSARIVRIESDATPDGGVSVSGLVTRFIEKRQVHDSKWEMTYVFGTATPEQAIEFEGTETTEDLYDLNSRAIVTLVTGSSGRPGSFESSPPTIDGDAMILRSASSRQLTDGGAWVHRAEYGLTSPVEDVTFPLTTATADAFDEDERVTASITSVSTTVTASAHADSLFAANMNDPLFRRVTAKKLTGSRILEVIEKHGGDKLLIGGGCSTYLDALRGEPAGGFGSVNANILVIAPGPAFPSNALGGYTSGNVIPIWKWRAQRRFVIQRVFVSNSPFPSQFLAVMGKVNIAAFMGHDANEVMFEGASLKYSLAISGTHLSIIHYHFKTDNLKFVNDGYLPISEVFVKSTGQLITQSGFYPHTMFANSGGLTWPESADFSGFTGPLPYGVQP